MQPPIVVPVDPGGGRELDVGDGLERVNRTKPDAPFVLFEGDGDPVGLNNPGRRVSRGRAEVFEPVPLKNSDRGR